MAVYKRGKVWWYEFWFAEKRIRESAKTSRKTLAVEAEKRRRMELEKGFNGIQDTRHRNIGTIREIAEVYLEDYRLRHRSVKFAEGALAHIIEHLGELMAVDFTDQTVKDYQTARLKQKAAPKTINDEVVFLLRLLGDRGEAIRGRLRRQKALKLPVRQRIGKPYSRQEKQVLLDAAKTARSPAIYPALTLVLNTGMRDSEVRHLQWFQMDLSKAIVTVGESKSEAGEGRTIPLNSALLGAMVDYAKWYTGRFGTIRPEWYVFPAGAPLPNDPTKPITTLKTAWTNVRKVAGVKGRWHDSRHTLVTELAESGAGDETIRDIAGHVSKRMLRHYAHIRMEAKRRALEAIVEKKADTNCADGESGRTIITGSSSHVVPDGTGAAQVN